MRMRENWIFGFMLIRKMMMSVKVPISRFMRKRLMVVPGLCACAITPYITKNIFIYLFFEKNTA
jgi:hypothetical protein